MKNHSGLPSLIGMALFLATASQLQGAESASERRAASLQRLRAATIAFDAALSDPSSRIHDDRSEWRDRLVWASWAPRLIDAGDVDALILQRISREFVSARDGLDAPPVVELRAALVAYLDLDEAERLAGAGYEQARVRHVAALERALATDPAGPAATAEVLDFAVVEAAAWWLAATSEAPDLVAQVRGRFNGPAIVGQIHRGLVETKLADFENETEEVRQTRRRVQGATVVGQATVKSQTRARLGGSPGEVRMQVTIAGTVDAPQNRSYKGSVKVTSASKSHFSGQAELYWDGASFASTEPQVEAKTAATIHEVDAPGTIRYAAVKRVNESREEMEQDSAAHIARQVTESMNARLTTAVDNLNRRSANFLGFLARAGIPAAEWRTLQTETAVAIGYRPPSGSGLGSLSCELPPLVGAEMAGLSFHDGAIEGILGAQVAGAEWRDLDFSKLQRELTGAVTEPLMIGLDPPRWGVQWSWRLPVRLRFRPDGAELAYQFQRVDVGNRRFDVPCRVCIDMTVAVSPLGHELRRRGPVVVESVDPQRPVPGEVVELLQSRFARPLDEPYHLLGLQFPAGGELDGLAGFEAADAQLADHWVHLKYSLRQSTSAPTVNATP
ncbi:MAG: hypothetical protein KF688_00155 [Pirellulales bacterium]|nr:hypothetical protein [Pirellulales bacterium]